jgi:hypothetical protein
MSPLDVIPVILAVGAASYAMRAGGYLAAGWLPQGGWLPRVLRLAPGNLFVAFAAAAVSESGWPGMCGCLASIAAMALTHREWAALGAGFAAAAVCAAWVG